MVFYDVRRDKEGNGGEAACVGPCGGCSAAVLLFELILLKILVASSRLICHGFRAHTYKESIDGETVIRSGLLHCLNYSKKR